MTLKAVSSHSDDRETFSSSESEDKQRVTVIIKKYANRRLYNTKSSQYVVLEDLAVMVREGVDFTVYDAKNGADITRSVLTQIIFEEEGKGNSLLPLSFLQDMIRLYGDNINVIVPGYLETAMRFFKRNRDELHSAFESAATAPLEGWRKIAESNREFTGKIFDMLNPFAVRNGSKPETEAQAEKIDALQQELNGLKQKLAAYEKGTGKS